MSKCTEEFSAETREVGVASFGAGHHIAQALAGNPRKKHVRLAHGALETGIAVPGTPTVEPGHWGVVALHRKTARISPERNQPCGAAPNSTPVDLLVLMLFGCERSRDLQHSHSEVLNAVDPYHIRVIGIHPIESLPVYSFASLYRIWKNVLLRSHC